MAGRLMAKILHLERIQDATDGSVLFRAIRITPLVIMGYLSTVTAGQWPHHSYQVFTAALVP